MDVMNENPSSQQTLRLSRTKKVTAKMAEETPTQSHIYSCITKHTSIRRQTATAKVDGVNFWQVLFARVKKHLNALRPLDVEVIHVFMYIYVLYIYIYKYIYIYIYVYICIYIPTYVYIHVYINTYI